MKAHCALAASGIATLLVVLVAIAVPAEQLPPVRIGSVIDGNWERNSEIEDLFAAEIKDLLDGEFAVSFPTDKQLVGDWTVPTLRANLNRLLTDDSIDFIIGYGIIASAEIGRYGPLPKPCLAPFVVDPDVQGIPGINGTSGVRNLNYLSPPLQIEKDLEVFREVVSFDRVHALTPDFKSEVHASVKQRSVNAVSEMGIEYVPVMVDTSIDGALQVLRDDPDVEAVYILPLMHLRTEQYDRLIAELNAMKMPTFSFFGHSEVRRGVLAGRRPESFFFQVARRVALNIQRILLGEKPSELTTAFPDRGQLVVNMSTARMIGVFPNWRIISEAILINEVRTEAERRIDLRGAMTAAVAVNIDLQASAFGLEADRSEVGKARANLLPQADLSARAVIIDKDRSSPLGQAERTVSGTAEISQVLWSEAAWANHSIQKHLFDLSENQHEALRLDIAFEAARAYLNVLRARTLEQLQRDNLSLSRSNLELAQVRRTVGQSGPGEVYRWESQIASNRSAVVDANASRNLAEMQLNRLLNRPAEESFVPEEASIDDPRMFIGDPRIDEHLNNKWSFRLFRDFLVEEARRGSPELKQLAAAIAARERALQSSRRSLFSPTVALKGTVTNVFSRNGEGADADFSGLPSGFSGFLKEPKDLSWSIGLQASLPLFEGGRRYADIHQNSEELRSLRVQRDALDQKIEQQVRSAAHEFGARRADIGFTGEAAEAARKNLELVTDAYSRGVVNVLDLLDAQNAALVANLVAADARYDFLIAYMEMQRATGSFDVLSSADERNVWFDRLREFVENVEASQ